MAEFQSTFFDSPPKIARSRDPISSHLAAGELVTSGKLAERERVALAMVNLNPGRTGEELDQMAHATKREISKRLAGLSAKQKIRRGSREEMRACQVTGRLCLTWWPKKVSQ